MEGHCFLDELNSMPLDLQAKMLRVLEDGVIRRIGDNKTRKVDVQRYYRNESATKYV